jgi:hypothetical protein
MKIKYQDQFFYSLLNIYTAKPHLFGNASFGYALHAILRTRGKGFAYGAAISTALLMGLLGDFCSQHFSGCSNYHVCSIEPWFHVSAWIPEADQESPCPKVSFSPYLVASCLLIGFCAGLMLAPPDYPHPGHNAAK